MFEDPYPNIFLLSKKNQGKTTVAFNILKKKANKHTTVIFFVGQLYKDPSYKEIVGFLKKKNIPYVLNNSLMDDMGENQLKELLDHLKDEYKDDFESDSDIEPDPDQQPAIKLYESESESEDELANSDIKPSKKNKLVPDYIILIDDLSEEIKGSIQISRLLKTNRHMKCMVIISSQYLNDLKPDAIANLDYILMFRKIPAKKVEEAYGKLNLDVPLALFRSMYNQATEDLHSFLYVDIKNDKYRKNFNHLFELSN